MTLRKNGYTTIALASVTGTNGVITSNGGSILNITGSVVNTSIDISRIEIDNFGTVAGTFIVNNILFPIPAGKTFSVDFTPTNTITINITGNFNVALLG